MLTGLKAPSLERKFVFYRPEHKTKVDPMVLNFEGLQIEKLNIPTDKYKSVDEKNGVICLVIIFTSGNMVIKMSKIDHFL